jgi:hypothetical protein
VAKDEAEDDLFKTASDTKAADVGTKKKMVRIEELRVL